MHNPNTGDIKNNTDKDTMIDRKYSTVVQWLKMTYEDFINPPGC